MLVKDAATVWNSLRGIICVYKPAEVTTTKVRKTIISSICRDLNEMDCRPPIDYVKIEGDPGGKLQVKIEPNLADHPLVVGPRYMEKDLVCSWSNHLGFNTSGVLLFGLRSGTKQAKFIRENRPTRAYRLNGKLGEATEDAFVTGKVLRKSTWKHVKSYHMEKLVASIQGSQQKTMFQLCGVDLQSQAAYELASKGLIRPANSKLPIIYGIKCVEFNPPEFTIEIHCVNEYESYLKMLIHDIGEQLRSTAHCTAIKCIRHSHFTLENALLKKHWNLQNIVTNLEECNAILEENEEILKQKSAVLR